MNQHIVHQLLLDVTLPSGSDTRKVDELLSEFAKGPLTRSLESLKSLETSDGSRLDRVEIDLGQISLDAFLREGAAQIAQAISREINRSKLKTPPPPHPHTDVPPRFPTHASSSRPPEPAVETERCPDQSASDHATPADALIHFLRSGHLPWWFPPQRWHEAVTPSRWAATTRSAFLGNFQQTLKHNLAPALRLARALSVSELTHLCPTPPALPRIESETAKRAILRYALTQLPAAQRPSTKFLDDLEPTTLPPDDPTGTPVPDIKLTPDTPAPPVAFESPKSQTQTEPSPKTNDNQASPTIPPSPDALADANQIASIDPSGLPIQNAGLVLLHPFLGRLFRTLNYLDESSQLLPEKRWRAAQLLQYLAIGESGLPEHTLVLEKTLCGIPLSDVAETPLLSATERDEADTLLNAAIDHWSVLGNTSPDGLRQSFLLRDGLLYLEGKPLRLQVEKRPYDMLLDRLPWQFKYVTLPWIQPPLLVQWRS